MFYVIDISNINQGQLGWGVFFSLFFLFFFWGGGGGGVHVWSRWHYLKFGCAIANPSKVQVDVHVGIMAVHKKVILFTLLKEGSSRYLSHFEKP